jgi:hypothetical protein
MEDIHDYKRSRSSSRVSGKSASSSVKRPPKRLHAAHRSSPDGDDSDESCATSRTSGKSNGTKKSALKQSTRPRDVGGADGENEDRGGSPMDKICDNCQNMRGKKGKCEKFPKWSACIRCHTLHLGCSLTSDINAYRAAERNADAVGTGKRPRSRSRSTSRSQPRRQRSQSRGRTEAKKGEVCSLTYPTVCLIYEI